MRIKKIVAPTMKEALARTKKELGPEAVILKSSKVKTGGLLDFTGKEAVEVLAAVDGGTKPIVPPVKTSASAYAANSAPSASIRMSAIDERKIIMLQSDLNELKKSMMQVSSFLKYRNVPSLPENLQYVMKQLLDNEVEEHIARMLVEEIHNELAGDEYNDLRLILSILLKKISEMIKVTADKPKTGTRPRVILLVGPTGVGKTTTIAKLATNQKLLNEKKVALISADTFRIGAIDQLKAFANIAEIPLTVVYTPDNMQTAIRNYGEMDVIYIDTTGRSQRDGTRLREMQKLVRNANPDETHLVLSITTRLRDLLEAAEKYALLKYNQMLITKIDETTSLGMILNLVTRVNQPISYITTGQNVPDDIERATVGRLARMIVRRKSN